jgi:HlyD family secretion protein
MDSEKLKSLQIDRESRRRSRGPLGLILLLIVLITAAGAYFAWPRKGDGQRVFSSADRKLTAGATNALSASTNAAPPAGGNEDVLLTVSGYIVNRERIELSPRFMGQVKWIGVRKGDTVTNGQVVVVLDDAEQRARVMEAEGRLTNAKASLEKAELDDARVRKLIADRIETKQAEDDARIRVTLAKSVIQEAEAGLALAKTYLDWTIIRATIDGVVLEKLTEAGELVTPQSFGGQRGPSTALIALADPKDLQVEIDLNEADVAKVSLRQPCRVSPEAYPDRHYDAYVAEMSPEANRQKGTLQIKVQIRNPDKFLTPELTAKVEFLKP